jgi:NADPH-dependent 2,4-dienoyl-CoA reductase/sulfur reductase-like enzyme
VIIIGAGAAGMFVAETLRGEGYRGTVTLIDREADAPYDRPNLSKDYLAGNAPDEWIPLRDDAFWEELRVNRIVADVSGIDVAKREVVTSDNQTFTYGALVLATGAQPIVPPIAGAAQAHVFTLRTWEDARTLKDAITEATRVVIAGASFIGMEAASALRSRNVDVTIVAPETVPFEKVLGVEAGTRLLSMHQAHGVKFHLGRTVSTILNRDVEMDDGAHVPADVVLLAVGVRPRTELAERSGLDVDRGVLVNEYMQASAPGIYAVGDIASFPYRDGRARIEHWVVAQRQGVTAALNILGRRKPFAAVPFFWTHQFDVALSYIGHGSGSDSRSIEGDLNELDCRITYSGADGTTAVATMNRDLESLKAEVEMERIQSARGK